MKYNPPGHRILVKPTGLEEEELLDKKFDKLKESKFVIQKPDGQYRREAQGTDQGTVVAIGPMAWKHKDYGYGDPDWQPWCKVGDKIIFGRYAGKLIADPDDGSDLMIINDDDVQLVEVKND